MGTPRPAPPHPRWIHRPARSCLAAALLLIVGCAGTEVRSRPFEGPQITLDEVRERHVVVVQTPSPGWDVDFDRSRRRLGGHDAFITLRRPDPRFLQPQVIVEKRVLTDVPAGEDIRVLAREVDHDARDPGKSYAPVPTVDADTP